MQLAHEFVRHETSLHFNVRTKLYAQILVDLPGGHQCTHGFILTRGLIITS